MRAGRRAWWQAPPCCCSASTHPSSTRPGWQLQQSTRIAPAVLQQPAACACLRQARCCPADAAATRRWPGRGVGRQPLQQRRRRIHQLLPHHLQHPAGSSERHGGGDTRGQICCAAAACLVVVDVRCRRDADRRRQAIEASTRRKQLWAGVVSTADDPRSVAGERVSRVRPALNTCTFLSRARAATRQANAAFLAITVHVCGCSGAVLRFWHACCVVCCLRHACRRAALAQRGCAGTNEKIFTHASARQNKPLSYKKGACAGMLPHAQHNAVPISLT